MTGVLFGAGAGLIFLAAVIVTVGLIVEIMGERVPRWVGVVIVATSALGGLAILISYLVSSLITHA